MGHRTMSGEKYYFQDTMFLSAELMSLVAMSWIASGSVGIDVLRY